MANCSKCGAAIDDKAQVCSSCGVQALTGLRGIFGWGKRDLIVIFVLGAIALAAIFYPLFAKLRLTSRKEHAVGVAKEFFMAATIYASDNDGLYPPIDTSTQVVERLRDFLHIQMIRHESQPFAKDYVWNKDLSSCDWVNLERTGGLWLFRSKEPTFGNSYLVAFMFQDAKFGPLDPLTNVQFVQAEKIAEIDAVKPIFVNQLRRFHNGKVYRVP
ncbi:MAG: zinc ribbon domain-containing protein [Armatimonadota bacterium]